MTPAVEGWFTTGPEPTQLGSRCTSCATVSSPPSSSCPDPSCSGTSSSPVPLSRQGVVWSYTDARYQPPAPYVAASPFEPFAIAAVTLPEGITVLGQVAAGFGVADLRVGAAVELVVEPLDEELLTWRWRPLASRPTA